MELCSNLNYLRSLSSGKAFFYYLDDNCNKCPLPIDRTRLRTPKSGYSEGYTGDFKPKNLAPQDLAFPNPQYLDGCYVPLGVDDIYCFVSLRIRANSLFPEICNDNEVRHTLTQLAEVYKKLGGYEELARRYAKNILRAKWVWRNRECWNVEVEAITENQKWKIADARYLRWNEPWEEESKAVLDDLTDYLTRALSDRTQYFNMKLTARLTIGWGDEIYPSQEFMDKDLMAERKKNGLTTKKLATASFVGGEETAAYHKEKVGAALQLIDDWWDDNADKPLRVNEYGADRFSTIARRHTLQERDFYSLIVKAESFIELMTSKRKIPDDVHFIMAVLVKGGLFNGASKKGGKNK